MGILINPIKKKSISEEVITEIKSLIDSGHIALGSKLPPEREFAKMLNVSRSSLREALKVLNLLGILENRPGAGTFLSNSPLTWPTETFSLLFTLKKSALIDIFESRKIIEGGLAALAAQRRTDEDLEVMKKALKNMRLHLNNQATYTMHELKFHEAIIKASRNLTLQDLMEKLYILLKETREKVFQYSAIENYRELDYKQHEAIYKAIKARNENLATKTIVDHLHNFEQLINSTSSP